MKSRLQGGSVAEWSARRWTRNLAVPCSSPPLVMHLLDLVLGLPKFKSSATLVNSQPVASCQLGFLILLYIMFKLFVSKYLSGVLVN